MGKDLQTNTDQVFTIGSVTGIRQPIVVGPEIRNVPKEGFYAWDPGGYLGFMARHVMSGRSFTGNPLAMGLHALGTRPW